MTGRTEMLSAGVHVVEVLWPEAEELVRPVREAVFVHEQGVPLELEWDGLDARCRHVVALEDGRMPVGTARMTPEGHIGRMAVLVPWRGRGVGAALLQHMVEAARNEHLPRVYLHAQCQALGFYERYGFRAEGEAFMDAGIAHRNMVRELSDGRAA